MFVAQKMSVKRKRMSFCRIPSSSSEEGAAAPLTESDLSDSVSADSHTHSAGEEEPPTKRKRDKALKTAAERNRKSGRMKTVSATVSPKGSMVQKVQPEETAVAQGDAKESSDEKAGELSARNSIPGSEVVTVVKSSEETGQRQPASIVSSHVHGEDCQVGNTDTVLEDRHDCAAEKRDAVDEHESVLVAAQEEQNAKAGDEVIGKKECTGVDYVTESSVAATDCLPEESNKEKCSVVKQSSCTIDGSEVGASEHVNTGTEGSVEAADNTMLNTGCSEDKDTNDAQSVHNESNGKQDDGCENHDKTHCADVTEVITIKDDDKPDVRSVNKLVSNGHTAKKLRGRPKKSSKKGRKKREHSKVTSSTSVTEVQETDYEPTKKLGRPSKKSKLAQLVADGCDSLPQSEDDIPLIELRRSARANKGQRTVDLLIVEQPKKRNRKDGEKERKRAEKEEKQRKREAELQEQAALKAKKVRNV